MVSGSVYGQTGPLAQHWGVDGTGAALSGRTFLTGWPDRDPVIPGAVPYGDVIVPYVMAAAVAAALHQRREHGRRLPHRRFDVRDLRAADARCDRSCRARRTPDALRQRRSARVSSGRVSGRGRGSLDRDHLSHASGLAHVVRRSLRCVADTTRCARRCTCARGLASATTRALAAAAAGARHRRRRGAGHRGPDRARPAAAARGALLTLDHPLLGAFGHVRTPVDLFAQPGRALSRAALGRAQSRRSRANSAGLSAQRIAELEAAGSISMSARRCTQQRPAQPQGPGLHGGGDRVPARVRRRPEAARRRRRRAVRDRAGRHAARDLPRDGHPGGHQPVVVGVHLRQAALATLFRRRSIGTAIPRTAAATARSGSPARSTTIRKVAPWGGLPKPDGARRAAHLRLHPARVQPVGGARSARDSFRWKRPAGRTRIRSGSTSRTTHWERGLRAATHRPARRRDARSDRAARSADRPPLR